VFRSLLDGEGPSLVRGDLDGFFGLMVDNLLQFLVILELCHTLCGMPRTFILTTIFPGAALSLIVGNLYYSWLARRESARTGQRMTALPYGINTVSLFAYILFVIAPTYRELSADPAIEAARAMRIAWQVGLVACLLSGLVEAIGGLAAGWVRRVTPRAALLSTLAGIAVGFISMEFILRTYATPLIGFVPLALVLVTYLSRIRWPLGLPGGMVAVAIGTGLAWLMSALQAPGAVPVGGEDLLAGAGWHPPVPVLGDLVAALGSSHVWSRISIIVPMGLINLLGALQCIESADAEGDRYPERGCLVVNGVGSIAAACFGSCFPTTIYIGHPGWKRMGAGWGYSAANGIFFALLATFGLVGPISRIVPVEAAMAILVWIAVIIVAQAFTATPKHHAPAVVLGLLPGLAAWGWQLIEMTLAAMRRAGFAGDVALPELLAGVRETAIPYVDGLMIMKSGFLFSATFIAAIGAFLADRAFGRAAIWSLAASVFAYVGLMHAYTVTSAALREEIRVGFAWPMALGYLGFALVCFAAWRLARPIDD
jgi:AGZA family xanthine/uracil permease-like MFS transporter